METSKSGPTLKTLLSNRTVLQLRQIAKSLHVAGISKTKKDELISAVFDALVNPVRLAELLYVVDVQTWKLFQCVMKIESPVAVSKSGSEQYRLLADLCYLHLYQEGDCFFCEIPQEIRDVWEQLAADGFKERKAHYDLLHHYAQAAVNLYGVISQRDFVQLFNAQNTEKITLEDLLPILNRHLDVDADYCFWDEYLVCGEFEQNDFKDVQDLLARVAGKPRYIPEKHDLLRYADWDYYEPTEQTRRLEQLLNMRMGLSKRSARKVVSEIHFAITVEADSRQIFNILAENYVGFTWDRFEGLPELIMQMSNSTRLWSNNGHTTEEMLRENAHCPSMTAQKIKIGRNDPCPCGSGKKYKRCCGR